MKRSEWPMWVAAGVVVLLIGGGIVASAADAGDRRRAECAALLTLAESRADSVLVGVTVQYCRRHITEDRT